MAVIGNPKLLKNVPPIRDTAAIEIPESGGKVVMAKFSRRRLEFAREPAVPVSAALAAWVVSPENPMFARAAVNRMWATFFGQGLVEPVDDMRPESRPLTRRSSTC